jgi:hypothetical protein
MFIIKKKEANQETVIQHTSLQIIHIGLQLTFHDSRDTKHTVVIFCVLLTGVLMWLLHYLKKVSFHVQEQRSVYVVTVLEAQLNTSALAVTLPHLSLVPNKYKNSTLNKCSNLRPQTVRAVTDNNNLYNDINWQNETADCV